MRAGNETRTRDPDLGIPPQAGLPTELFPQLVPFARLPSLTVKSGREPDEDNVHWIYETNKKAFR